jgi:hypothetical protein
VTSGVSQTLAICPMKATHGKVVHAESASGRAPDGIPASYRRVGTARMSRPLRTPEAAPQPPIPVIRRALSKPSIKMRKTTRVRI